MVGTSEGVGVAAQGGAPSVPAMAPEGLRWAALILVIVAGLAGGASRDNALALGAVELAGVGGLLVAWRAAAAGGLGAVDRVALALAAAIAVVPLLQLLPLPPALWRALPTGALRARSLAAVGAAQGWAPLSLTPYATAAAFLALVPPIAMFLIAAQLAPAQRSWTIWGWLGVAAAGLMLGAAQLASPDGGPAYLWRFTNFGALVGLFANRNHEAALLLAVMPLSAAALQAGAGRRGGGWLALAGVFVPIVALAAVRSRAGVLLAPVSLAGTLGILAAGTGRGIGRLRLAVVAVALLALLAVVAFALAPLAGRFAEGGDLRPIAWRTTIAAARPLQPWGAGLGAYAEVFAAAEPWALLRPGFFDHAHNDWLELWLETGALGAAILLVFLVWFAARAWRAWRRRGGKGLPAARAASLVVPLLLAASLVDYPLRTETLSVLFAWACGVLAAGARASGSGIQPRRRSRIAA